MEGVVTYIRPVYEMKVTQGLTPLQIKCLSLWKAGRDTMQISEALYIPEHEARRQLNKARGMERTQS
jgi:DNA-binding CsgD family transcriptional regulator